MTLPADIGLPPFRKLFCFSPDARMAVCTVERGGEMYLSRTDLPSGHTDCRRVSSLCGGHQARIAQICCVPGALYLQIAQGDRHIMGRLAGEAWQAICGRMPDGAFDEEMAFDSGIAFGGAWGQGLWGYMPREDGLWLVTLADGTLTMVCPLPGRVIGGFLMRDNRLALNMVVGRSGVKGFIVDIGNDKLGQDRLPHDELIHKLRHVHGESAASRDELALYDATRRQLIVTASAGCHRVGLLPETGDEHDVQWLDALQSDTPQTPLCLLPDGRILLRRIQGAWEELWAYTPDAGTLIGRYGRVMGAVCDGTRLFLHAGRTEYPVGLVSVDLSTLAEQVYPNTSPLGHEYALPPVSGQVRREAGIEYISYHPHTPKGRIFCLHGGPYRHWQAEHHMLQHCLAHMGFEVICPNYRGSTGYGRAFQDALQYRWGIPDLQDLMALYQALQQENPLPCMVMGESYGAFLALRALAAHPWAWKLGLLYAGFGDPAELLTVAGPALRKTLLHKAVKADTPPRPPNLAAITAPVLLLHGRYDDIIPFSQTQRLAVGLRLAGKQENRDFWCHALDTGHMIADYAATTHLYKIMLDFIMAHQEVFA